jgi:transcriptional regulator with XRE-family HTH domain
MRQAAGLTLEDLARRADTTAGYLSRVERGERIPTDGWMRRVTGALGEYLTQQSVA